MKRPKNNKKIVRFMFKNTDYAYTSQEISDELGIDREYVVVVLREEIKKDLIEKDSIDKETYYIWNNIYDTVPCDTKSKIKFKRCVNCKKSYPYTSRYFYKSRNRDTGLSNWCILCSTEHNI